MSRKSSRSPVQARSSARLSAVQALYDSDITGASVEAVLADFINNAIGGRTMLTDEDEQETEIILSPADPLLLTAILRGSLARLEQLDEMISQALTGDWSVERLDSLLHAILRAGAFELSAMPETPARVVISEYVDVASAFYGGPEPGLVNAVLDRLARVVRAVELSEDGRT
jgi:N utilization substance protein B